jgi:hypothetical protein
MKMGNLFFILSMVSNLTNVKIAACPACTARVTEQTPPFFANDFNKSDDSICQTSQSIDEQENV